MLKEDADRTPELLHRLANACYIRSNCVDTAEERKQLLLEGKLTYFFPVGNFRCRTPTWPPGAHVGSEEQGGAQGARQVDRVLRGSARNEAAHRAGHRVQGVQLAELVEHVELHKMLK
jgi:hypothetical protein